MDPETLIYALETEHDAHEAQHILRDLVEWINRGGFHPTDIHDRLRAVARRAKDASMSLTASSRHIQDSRELAYRCEAYADTLSH